MIIINNTPLDSSVPELQFTPGGVERSALEILKASPVKYQYDSLQELLFELRLRKEIVQAGRDLDKSTFAFEVFKDSRCNPSYWNRRNDGGFVLKSGVKASEAIRDIYRNGSKYGTECATAMLIVYYKALLHMLPEETYNRLFRRIVLMNWHDISPELRETGLMQHAQDYLPGDRRYFSNPEVDPKTPEWQGENVIDLGDGLYYGHGIGIHKADVIIRVLNENRREGARKEAYLLDRAGRPDFRALAGYSETAPRSAAIQQTA
jgi:protein-glutamine gamma-glutamyltransferase